MLALATEAARAAGTSPHRLVGLPILLLDVPIGNEAEFVFVRALAAAATEVLATVPAADQPTLGRLRDRLPMQIEQSDEVPFRDERTTSATSTSALSNLQRRLFSEQAGPIEGKPDDTVEVFSAPGEGRQCIEIARRVLSLARRGVPFERIAVLMRSPEEYRAYSRGAFNRAGIPVHYARGAVRPDPAGRTFCALLKCAAEGLSAQRFAEYLSLGQVPDAAPGGTPPDAAPGGDYGVGGGLAVERQSEVGPYHQSDIVDWIVAHERVVAGHLATVKIHAVRPKGDLGDPIPIFLAERFAWVLRLKAVEPLALMVSIEKLATGQRAHPDGQIIRGGDDASGREGIGRILPRVVIGLEGSPQGFLILDGQLSRRGFSVSLSSTSAVSCLRPRDSSRGSPAAKWSSAICSHMQQNPARKKAQPRCCWSLTNSRTPSRWRWTERSDVGRLGRRAAYPVGRPPGGSARVNAIDRVARQRRLARWPSHIGVPAIAKRPAPTG